MSRIVSMTLLVAVLAISAVEGVARKAKGKPVTCGDTIDKPGNYYLSGDCSGDGITITASRVTLKLMGHTMTGRGDSPGIYATNVSRGKIIGPGTITNYHNGVHFLFVTNSIVERVTATLNSNIGILLSESNDNEVKKNVTENAVVGIWADVANNNEIVENQANQNAIGIHIHLSSGNEIQENEANDNSLGIGLVDSTGNQIEENTALNNNVRDLEDVSVDCDFNIWEDNVFLTRSQDCIN